MSIIDGQVDWMDWIMGGCQCSCHLYMIHHYSGEGAINTDRMILGHWTNGVKQTFPLTIIIYSYIHVWNVKYQHLGQ